jgi:hypothetical protein
MLFEIIGQSIRNAAVMAFVPSGVAVYFLLDHVKYFVDALTETLGTIAVQVSSPAAATIHTALTYLR